MKSEEKNRPYMISRALSFAYEKHLGQKDDSGINYVEAHLIPVFEIIKMVFPDDRALQCAALLHDTLEDTDTTYEELSAIFGVDVANLVLEVTHEGDKEKANLSRNSNSLHPIPFHWVFENFCKKNGINCSYDYVSGSYLISP